MLSVLCSSYAVAFFLNLFSFFIQPDRYRERGRDPEPCLPFGLHQRTGSMTCFEHERVMEEEWLSNWL